RMCMIGGCGLSTMKLEFTIRTWMLRVAVFLVFANLPAAADPVSSPASLDKGFRLLYSLEFDQAHQVFSAWQQEYPDNPLGPVCDAAGMLFSEFHRLGILESQFYQDDKTFDARQKQIPDPQVYERFDAALDQAESRARTRLAKDPKDRDALFAMTLAAGLRADYAALIEKRNLASLR